MNPKEFNEEAILEYLDFKKLPSECEFKNCSNDIEFYDKNDGTYVCWHCTNEIFVNELKYEKYN